MKILVVEDNFEAQTTLCELLEMLDYQANGVATAEEALDKLPHFDIILTDVNLPGISGIELAQKINTMYPTKPIIISSGMDISTQLQFDVQVLPKPFSVTVLLEILEKAKILVRTA
jgi:CheY-like chemotaxis protein